ncbi:hypothetical protein Agub_g2993, partial [Astrephomene gubernaculifera]
GYTRYQARYRAEGVREAYLGDTETGLTSALLDALKSLFSAPRLPDNPYYALAAHLNAHVDQGQLWKTPAADLLSVYDIEGGLEPIFGELQLCKLSSCGTCFGLPHVLRVVTREAVSLLHVLLTNGLPECLFNSTPLPALAPGGGGGGAGGGVAAGAGPYSVQALCSIQDSSALWRPQLLEFPELDIRCDVVVRGDKLDEALRLFVDVVLNDVGELHQVPVFFVDGVAIVDGPAVEVEADKEPFSRWCPLDQLLEAAEEFRRTATRLVLGGKVLRLHAVLLVESPADPSDLSATKLRYEQARKTYCFHYQYDQEVRPGLSQPMSHYGCYPYDALYGGYFLDLSTARQYCALYLPTDNQPYHKNNLNRQMSLLRSSIAWGLQRGGSLAAWRQLLLLVLLHDPTTVRQQGQQQQDNIPSLEDLALKAPQVLGGELGWLLSTVPNILRITNSAASVLEGIVRELEGISVAAERWPAKLAAVKAAAAAAAAAAASGGSGGRGGGAGNPPPWNGAGEVPLEAEGGELGGTADSRRTLRTPEVSRAMVAWLSSFDMESRLLGQLLGLRERIRAATGAGGAGLFGGISLMAQRLVSELPPEVPPLAPAAAAALAAAQPRVALLQHLLHAAALTVSHGFVTRCADVKWALMRLGVPLAGGGGAADMGALTQGSAGNYDDVGGPPPASWVLDVGLVRGAQVRSGALAERVSAEGVMLQYAVDCKLDELLATLWQVMTDPPLPLNPYPKLLHLLRSGG